MKVKSEAEAARFASGAEVGVVPAQAALSERAASLAARFGLPLVASLEDAGGLVLVLTEQRLELRERGSREGPVYVDFLSGRAARRRRQGGGTGQALARAVGLKGGFRPRVLDATAGMGRDAFVLAGLGCRLTLIERSPVVAALLADGLRRAADAPSVAEIAARLSLVHGESTKVLQDLSEPYPDVIYIDPMYPPSGKRAKPKKDMQRFRSLLGPDTDSAGLLDIARQRAGRRVVVKRPKAAPPLVGPEPNAQVNSKHTRYDVYSAASLKK